jgi:hypothetical protein
VSESSDDLLAGQTGVTYGTLQCPDGRYLKAYEPGAAQAAFYRPTGTPSAADDAAYAREWAAKHRAMAADWRKRAEFKEELSDHDTVKERIARADEYDTIAKRLEGIAGCLDASTHAAHEITKKAQAVNMGLMNLKRRLAAGHTGAGQTLDRTMEVAAELASMLADDEAAVDPPRVPPKRCRVTCEGGKLYLARAIDEDAILWEDAIECAEELPPLVAAWIAAEVGGAVEEVEGEQDPRSGCALACYQDDDEAAAAAGCWRNEKMEP